MVEKLRIQKMPDTIELERDFIKAYWLKERDVWLGAKAIADRSNGMNGEALLNQKNSMARLDQLHDEYNDTVAHHPN